MFKSVSKHKTTIVVLLVIILGLSFLAYQFISVSGVFSDLKNDLKQIEPEEGSAYQNLNGENVSLNEYRGQVLIVNSWASWSPFSKDDLKLLSDIQLEYGNQISVLAINRKESLAVIKGYLRAFDMDFNSIEYLFDPTDNFYLASGGFAMPETIIYNKDGTILSHTRGSLDADLLRSTLNNLLE